MAIAQMLHWSHNIVALVPFGMCCASTSSDSDLKKAPKNSFLSKLWLRGVFETEQALETVCKTHRPTPCQPILSGVLPTCTDQTPHCIGIARSQGIASKGLSHVPLVTTNDCSIQGMHFKAAESSGAGPISRAPHPPGCTRAVWVKGGRERSLTLPHRSKESGHRGERQTHKESK